LCWNSLCTFGWRICAAETTCNGFNMFQLEMFWSISSSLVSN
jgi:hypothetical protein